MAAVGRKNWRIERPAVTLRASVAPTTRSPVRTRTLSRCQSVGRNRHSQPSSRTTIRTAIRNQPTKLATSGLEVLRPSALIFSMASVVIRSPDDTIFSPWRIETMTGWTAARALAFSCVGQLLAERGVAHDERADQLRGERPLLVVEAAGHEPGEPGPGLRHVAVEQLGAQQRVEDPGGLGADHRPAAGIHRQEGRLRGVGQARDGHLEQACPLVRGDLGGERGVDPGDALLERDLLLVGERDGLLGGEVVDGRHVLDGRVLRGRGLAVAGELQRARRHDVARREIADRRGERRLRQDLGPEDRGEHRDEDPGRDREPDRVVAREPGDRLGALGQHGSVIGASRGLVRAAVVGDEIGRREGGGDHPAHDLAIGAAAGLRGQPAHDLAHVAGGGGAGRARRPRATRAETSASVSACGRYSERMAISASSFVARSSRPAARNASTDSRRVFTSRVSTPRSSSSVRGCWFFFSRL